MGESGKGPADGAARAAPRRAQRPEALIFDVFGTLVDWRIGVARQVAAAFAAKGLPVDALAFADAWRAEYQPAMARIRDGARGYVPLDDLHRENLKRVLAMHRVTAFGDDEVAALARAWERLAPGRTCVRVSRRCGRTRCSRPAPTARSR